MANRDIIRNGIGMIGSPPLLQLEQGPGGEEIVSAALVSLINLFQQDIVRKMNGGISFGNGDHATQTGNIQGQWVEISSTPSVADTQFAVPHGLGRVPVGVIKLRSSEALTIYDSNIGGWSSTTIYLKCNVALATVRIVLV